MMFSNRIEEQLDLYRREYYTSIHTSLCNAMGVPIDTFMKCQDPRVLSFRLADENKLFDVMLKMISINGLLQLHPVQLFDFSFYPDVFTWNTVSIRETIDKLVESVPKYKGTLSYVFLWDILLLESCDCKLLEEVFLKCLELQIGAD